jgi:D-serine deaminase-like pyridoxal phosphate-dependent protein
MDAPAAGNTGRGTVTEAVALAPSAVDAAAAAVGCAGLLLFEHAAAARHTAAATANREFDINIPVN